uniref:Uncharacterized protein n=1 Tax=Anguilla anguilla TaxID=7936 RepID=A0A0E9SKS6_ANGAN
MIAYAIGHMIFYCSDHIWCFLVHWSITAVFLPPFVSAILPPTSSCLSGATTCCCKMLHDFICLFYAFLPAQVLQPANSGIFTQLYLK